MRPDAGSGPDQGCRYCAMPAQHTLTLALDDHALARIRLCNAHACAMQLGDWTLTLRVMDMVATLRGRDA